jgi:hypothetical protein
MHHIIFKIKTLKGLFSAEDKYINRINKIAHRAKFGRVGGYLSQTDTTLKKYLPIK